jgi:RNA polymerase sigma-70 factor (ECF subfamily)
MRRASGGGADRFADLYERHARRLLAFGQRRLGNRSDAEEMVAETFVVCWRRLDDVPEGDGALPWLYGVAGRVVANQRRSQRRRGRLVERLELHARSAGGAAPADHAVLEEALDALRPDDRRVLLLAAWEGLGPSDLALALRCTPNAAAIRLHRARRRLAAEFLRRKGPGPFRT